MKRTELRTLLAMSTFFLVVLPSVIWADGIYSGGTGLSSNPYRISSAADMAEIGQHSEDWADYFIVTEDINMAGYDQSNFTIIGNDVTAFTGVFDGNNHTISNFTYNLPDTNDIGLFGYVNADGAEISDLILVNPNITGYHIVGSLVSFLASGTIINCEIQGGSITGVLNTGGLAGQNFGAITNCSTTCDVTGLGASSTFIGGLVGYNYGTILNSYAEGLVAGSYDIGGLAGLNLDTISNCYANGSVTGALGVGGLLGLNISFGGSVGNCYATGLVTGSLMDFGGLVGTDSSGVYNNCFWNISVNPSLTGIGNIADPLTVMGKTTTNMQTKATYTAYGWDFINIWDICEGTYPKLVWSIPAGDLACPDGIDFIDFAIFASAWMTANGDAQWNPACDISDPNDDVINTKDLDVFCEYWLAGTQ